MTIFEIFFAKNDKKMQKRDKMIEFYLIYSIFQFFLIKFWYFLLKNDKISLKIGKNAIKLIKF